MPIADELIDACKHALIHNLGLRQEEKVLVITDAGKVAIGLAFKHAAQSITLNVEFIEIPVPRFNGEEPIAEVAEEMLTADVVLLPTSKSLSWTKARQNATERGARIASMPRISKDIILRTFPVDYTAIKNRVNQMCDVIDNTKRVSVKTDKGTDIEFSVAGREAHGRKGGIYTSPGAWGNLPCGEAFVAPVEGSANGVYIVDASQAGVGELQNAIRISVESGRAVKFDGGEEAGELERMLADVGDPNAFNIAEFGIGCNDKAQVIGVTLEDEKVLGTCHIALGNNMFFGGIIDVGVHVDGVINLPTIAFDEVKIMERGKRLI